MNVCFFGGRLVKDFEKREFVDIVIFTTKLCEIAEKYIKKGDYCVYECELSISEKDGKKYVSAVVKNIIFTQNNKKKEE